MEVVTILVFWMGLAASKRKKNNARMNSGETAQISIPAFRIEVNNLDHSGQRIRRQLAGSMARHD